MMPTNYSHPPVISCYLVLYDPHEVEVDLSLLVLVHPRLQYRSAEWSHVQQPLNRSVIRILGSHKKNTFQIWLTRVRKATCQRSTGKRITCYGLRYTSLNIPTKKKVDSFSDPHWFQCGSGSSFLSQCGSESGSREQKQCGSGSATVTKGWILTWKYTLCK